MIYLQLFLAFVQIGAFSFGGGYAAMPLIQNQVVTIHEWLSMSEFTDLVTISQMTPGPIAINAATFVGTKIAGTLGGIVATLGCILPSCIIVSIITYFYLKYRHLDVISKVLQFLRPAVVALIATAGVSILQSAFFPDGNMASFQLDLVIIFIFSLYLLMKKKVNPIYVMVLSGILHLGQYYLFQIL